MMVLQQKLENKSATIAIIGMGYVGLPLMLRYVEVGYTVIGIDIDSGKVARLRAGASYLAHIPSERIAQAIGKNFTATTDFSAVKNADAIIICVPTPLNKYREPDISYIVDAVEKITPHIKQGQIISLESTTYPGTTEEELLPRLQARGLKIGEDIFLVFSPEREDPGNKNFTVQAIPRICGGVTANCLQMGIALYSQVIDEIVPVSSTRAAEMSKLLENIHRAVNIGLVNEMKIVCDKMGLDIYEIIRAAATKPFGFVPYYPGPGLGGHCIPIDPFYLTWKAREYGVHTKFIELAGEINRAMPNWVIGKVVEGLNLHGKAIKGSKILVLGVAYKKDVDDLRESPALEMMRILAEKGAELSYSDPHVLHLSPGHEHIFSMENRILTQENLAAADCVLIATHHSAFDFSYILQHSRLIVDSRGVYPSGTLKVIKA